MKSVRECAFIMIQRNLIKRKMKTLLELATEERQRQIDEEGWMLDDKPRYRIG